MTNNPSVAAPFPTDNSPQSKVTRIQTTIAALQNLNGPGVGCPAASTTFSVREPALSIFIQADYPPLSQAQLAAAIAAQ
jgi:hypothetical protein